MTRTYFFGCHPDVAKLRTLAINMTMTTGQVMAAKKMAAKEACTLAADKGYANPALLFECGVPDLRIVIEDAEIVAVYYRNAEIQPVITVTNLDDSDDRVSDERRLYEALREGGFELLPHVLDLPSEV